MEYHNLMKMSRTDLNEMAKELGASDPNEMGKKHDVVNMILVLGEAKEDSGPSVEITTHTESDTVLPDIDDDDELIDVIITGSQVGINTKIYRRGERIKVSKKFARECRHVRIPVSENAQLEIERLKLENAQLRRGLK